MPGFTPYFQLAYFDFGDVLAEGVNVQREIDRFVTIDKQIYGLYSIFGNGIFSGWTVSDNGYTTENGISISISSGQAIIGGMVAETLYPTIVYGLDANTTLYIYASLRNNTPTTRIPSFSISTNGTLSSSDLVEIATVITSNTGISSIDNTTRDLLVIESVVETAINNHRHRGNPTKIDLETDVKNQLPSARIESVDTSKVTTGRFDLERIPLLNHNELANIGVLTHAQIDAYINSFTNTNQDLLGEVATANLIKQHIFLKDRYPTVDDKFVNEIIYIPGVSDSSLVDDTNTTAIVDTVAKCIAGFFLDNAVAYFFTNGIYLAEDISKCFIAADYRQPSDSQVIFGVGPSTSVNFDSDYTTVDLNKVTDVSSVGDSIRVGIKIISPSDVNPHDPYLTNFEDYVDFIFTNQDTSSHFFHFRVRFYNNESLTNLHTTAYSLTDQEGWIIDDEEQIPAAGYEVSSGGSVTVTFYPNASDFVPNKYYYLIIDVWDGTSFASASTGYTFVSSGNSSCDIYVGIPIVTAFGFMFSLADGTKLAVNENLSSLIIG